MSQPDSQNQEKPFRVYLDETGQQAVIDFKIKGKSMTIGLTPQLVKTLRKKLEKAEERLFADQTDDDSS